MYLCFHKDLIGLQFLTDTLQRYFVNRKNFNCLHAGVYRVHYFTFSGRGTGVSDFLMSLA